MPVSFALADDKTADGRHKMSWGQDLLHQFIEIQDIIKDKEEQQKREQAIKDNPRAKILTIGGRDEMRRQASKYSAEEAEYDKQRWNERVANDELARTELTKLELWNASAYEFSMNNGIFGRLYNVTRRMFATGTALSEEEFLNHESYKKGYVTDYKFAGRAATKEFMDFHARERRILETVKNNTR